MAIVEILSPTADGHRRLGLASPATGEPVGEIIVSTPDEVTAVIARARAAQPAWAALPAAERAAIIARALDVLLARKDEILATVQAESGKPLVEALAIEIVPSCDFINYWAGRAAKDLADERVGLHGYLKPLKKLYLHYQPLGVVGVITPWNGPFVLSINPAVQALLAGNAVVLKPSEVTPHSGGWAAKVLWEAGVPRDVLQLVHGDGESGAALVNGDIDKISFTGSVGTGKKIAAACAARLIPCSLELGGKDAMIVCSDADLERAANGAVYLSMFNSGQVCVSVERIYVVDSVADEFIKLVRQKAETVTYGEGNDVGPLFWDRQLDIVSRHVEDARAKGATVLVGGGAGTGKGLFYPPTVVTGLTHDMDLMSEETFGPGRHHAGRGRGRGRAAGQRLQVRPERQRLHQGPEEGHADRPAAQDRIGGAERRGGDLRRRRGAVRRSQGQRAWAGQWPQRDSGLYACAADSHRPLGPEEGEHLVPLRR